MPTYPGPATPELVSFFNTQSDTPGPFFLGAILNWGLFHGVAAQVYIYYTASKNDRIGLKFLVGFLFLATIAQTGFATYCAWQILVVSWSKTGDFIFHSARETASVLPIINGIISATVQIFFSWRIWFLNRTTVGWIFAVLIGIIAILQLLAMIVFTLFHRDSSTLLIGLIGSFVADVLITLSMIYALRMAQRQSLSKGARAIISRLMMNAIRTGAITAVVAGVGLVLLLLSVDYSQTIALVLGPLFPNVCLANLNSRARIRRLGDDPQFSTVHAGERNPGSGRATTLRFARPPSISAQSGATGSRIVHAEMGAGPVHMTREHLHPPHNPSRLQFRLSPRSHSRFDIRPVSQHSTLPIHS